MKKIRAHYFARILLHTLVQAPLCRNAHSLPQFKAVEANNTPAPHPPTRSPQEKGRRQIQKQRSPLSHILGSWSASSCSKQCTTCTWSDAIDFTPPIVSSDWTAPRFQVLQTQQTQRPHPRPPMSNRPLLIQRKRECRVTHCQTLRQKTPTFIPRRKYKQC